MSTHRYTEKPRLLPGAGAPVPESTRRSATPTAEPDPASQPRQPSQPYPGIDSRNPNRLRRHWFSIFSMLLPLFACASAAAQDEGLAFRGDTGWESALALDTQVDMQVRGLIAEVTVQQTYVNASDRWQEARYLLPLPPDAAVGSLQVRIGQRLIVGEVREKEAARKAFVQAAESGQRAALVEQARPNLFRTGLSNIGPGETINVEIGYWQAVDYRDGGFSISLPLTLTPRYAAAALALATDEQSDPIPLRAAHPTPGLEPTLSLTVDLRAGVPVSAIDSPTHRVTVTSMPDFQRVQLADLVELADRDFELRWQPLASQVPQRAVFSEEIDGEHYALLMLLPPTLPVQALSREVILVIDTSGSMSGSAIEQATAALDAALLTLGPDDRFNVIRFSDTTERLFPESMPASIDMVTRARRHVASLQADGGTEMAPALQMAFEGAAPAGMVRQVVLATDAAISNEAALLTMIDQRRGDSRLFPIGIGSAPNGHFIRKAAEIGRGTQVLIRDIAEVGERMGALFTRIERPLLREIDVQWPDAIDIYPPRLPDLYHGEPLLVIARLPVLQGEMAIVGQTRGQPWRSTLRLDPLHVIAAEGVGRLWARARIEALEDAMREGLDPTEGREQIVEAALQHGLASRYTSLVAVEQAPSRPEDEALASTDIANAAPADALAMAQGSSSARSKLGLAITLALMATAVFRRREPEPIPGLA